MVNVCPHPRPVGDNVGDCATRGADLFESIATEVISAMILGRTMAKRCKIEEGQVAQKLGCLGDPPKLHTFLVSSALEWLLLGHTWDQCGVAIERRRHPQEKEY